MRNVLMVSVDDLFAVQMFRNTFGVPIHTPNMDRLGNMGISFENAFCTTALCTPSRTAILTGENPFSTGVHTNSQRWFNFVDPSKTLPALFQDANYHTSSFGKVYPTELGTLQGTILDVLYNAKNQETTIEEQTGDFLNIKKALDTLASMNQSQPYFMMVGFNDPHAPHVSPQKYYDLYLLDQIIVPNWEGDDVPEYVKQFLATEDTQRMIAEGTMDEFIQGYLANISEMDARLGELLDGVEQSGTDPIIMLWGDHGFSAGDHDHHGKFTLWDQAGRTPFMIYDSQIPDSHGVKHQDVVSLIDVAPTLLDMIGLPIPERMDGNSLKPLVRDPSLNSEGVALTTMFGSISARFDEWRISRYEDGPNGAEYELFHIPTDPDNSDNLANEPEHAEQLQLMKEKLEIAVKDWGITIDDGRNLLSAANADGGITYFVNEHTDLSGISGSNVGEDEIFSSIVSFRMPDWVENYTASLRHWDTGVNVVGNIENNVIISSEDDDIVKGGGGNDTIFSSRGADTVYGQGGGDVIDGNLGKDVFYGGSGGDRLIGAQENDRLLGEHGSDILEGGTGRDTLTGGLNNDIFKFGRGEVGLGSTTRDIILDFKPGEVDKINLQGIDANNGVAGDQAFTFRGTKAFNAAGQVRANDLGSTVILQGSTDADIAAEFEIEVRNFTGTFVGSDFVL